MRHTLVNAIDFDVVTSPLSLQESAHALQPLPNCFDWADEVYPDVSLPARAKSLPAVTAIRPSSSRYAVSSLELRPSAEMSGKA